MFGQVITAHERLLTHRTDMFLFTGMSASMSAEFVRTSEDLLAVRPRTIEGFLACDKKRDEHLCGKRRKRDLTGVQAHVCFQVRRFVVFLRARRIGAGVVLLANGWFDVRRR